MYSFNFFLEPLFFPRYISSTIEIYTFLHGKDIQKNLIALKTNERKWLLIKCEIFPSCLRRTLNFKCVSWGYLRMKNEPSSLFSPAITTIRLKLPVSLMNLGLSGRNASTVPTSDPSTTGPQGFPTDPGWKDSWQNIKIFIGPASNTDVSYGKLSL